MAEDEKKPEKPSKWGFKMPDLAGAMKGVTDAAKAAKEKGEQAYASGKEAGDKALAKGKEAAKQAQDKMKKDKPADPAVNPEVKKDDNKPPSP